MGITTHCFMLTLYGLGETRMAPVKFHGSRRSLLKRGKTILLGLSFCLAVVVYLALNKLTEWHEFDRLGITLWSPDNGLSLALLIESFGIWAHQARRGFQWSRRSGGAGELIVSPWRLGQRNDVAALASCRR